MTACAPNSGLLQACKQAGCVLSTASHPRCSRMFIWYHAKEAYKPGTGTMNEGCTLRACFKQVQLKGACDETLFPYSWNYLPYPPSDGKPGCGAFP